MNGTRQFLVHTDVLIC